MSERIYAIPEELRVRPRWVLWKLEERGGKGTKVPYTPNGTRAKSDDPRTWSPFEMALDCLTRNPTTYTGLGFVFAKQDGLIGVDLDHCLDPSTGKPLPWARHILDLLDSYTEISPSGTGLHVILKGTKPDQRCKQTRVPGAPPDSGFEWYDSQRYFTVSGDILPGAARDIALRNGELTRVRDLIWPPNTSIAHHQRNAGSDDDQALLERIRASAQGQRFDILWQGDWRAAGYPSQSEADLALCAILAFWARREGQAMDRLFRLSGLFRPEKWDRNAGHGRTYGERTIERACLGYGVVHGGHFSQTRIDSPNATHHEDDWEPETSNWPKLDPIALPGFIDDFIALATADSEADPAAVLATLLCRFGSEVYGYEPQKGPYCYVGETRHFPRMFITIVGATAKARKGTSAGPIKSLFGLPEITNSQYIPAKMLGGPLSSGEGLIYCVRDERKEWQISNKTGEGRWVVADPGVTDKRLFILDEELAAAMASLKREGCTLSAALRQVWDSGCYSPMTKRERTACSDAHINIVTHTTNAELRIMLEEIQALNGFANRFLWVCARRNKIVAEPKRMNTDKLIAMQTHLYNLIQNARNTNEMIRSSNASKLWCQVYQSLSTEHSGIAGAIIARAEAHVTRLSMIYALMDGHEMIHSRHLSSALAFWKYCKESVLYLFPKQNKDRILNKVEAMLRSGPMTGTDIYRKMANHVSKTSLTKALEELIASGKVVCKTEQTSGRPRKVYEFTN